MLIRTHAFLGRKTWLLILMLSSLLTVFIYQLWALIANMDLLALGPPTVPSPCFPVAKPGTRHVMGFFVAPLIFDAAITGLSVYKALSMRWNLPWSKARESTSIVNTFINEGLFYFLLITTANLLNGIFYLQCVLNFVAYLESAWTVEQPVPSGLLRVGQSSSLSTSTYTTFTGAIKSSKR